MRTYGRVVFGGFLAFFLAVSAPVHAAAQGDSAASGEEEDPDFENENTYIDVSDALRSKQYVHRAILNSLVKETNRFSVHTLYISHMMGFNQIWQKGENYVKFSSGLQGLALGYITPWGHGIEIGGELSAVSNALVGYRYFIRPRNFGLWGSVGVGLGTEVTAVNFAEGPPEAALYNGPKQLVYASAALLVPAVDVGFKGEVRMNFYGGDRVVFTSGVGVILFF